MASPPKILAFAGSTRRGSFNEQLLAIAADGARAAGAVVTQIQLKTLELPLFDQDLEAEQGPPDGATALKQLMVDHQGLLLACPEYNSSVTPLLKNAIDWASRPAEGETPLVAFKGKTAAIMSASPGGLGGMRGLVHVRSILSSIGVLVLPDQVAVPRAYEAFAEDGSLKDEKKRAAAEWLGKQLAQTLAKLHA